MKGNSQRSIIHVVYNKESRTWLIRYVLIFDIEGNEMQSAPDECRRKADAVERAIKQAKEFEPSSLRIHTRDGKIAEERTFPRSSDPRRTKG